MGRAQAQYAATLTPAEQPRLAGLAGDSPREGAVGDNSPWEPETSLAAATRARVSKGCTKEQAEVQLCAPRMGRGMCQVPFQLLYQSVPIPAPQLLLMHGSAMTRGKQWPPLNLLITRELTGQHQTKPSGTKGWNAGPATGGWWLCHETRHRPFLPV